MAALSEQSQAHVILEAVRETTNANITALRQLTARRPDALKLELTLRILLTYLPEGTEPILYVDFLRDLSKGVSNVYGNAVPRSPATSEQELSEDEARRRARSLRLTALLGDRSQYDQNVDPLTLFLLRQAHKIDDETGSLVLVSQLLEPFVDHSDVLRTWMISTLLPVLRLDYEYYPTSGSSHTLDEFEKLDGRAAVQSLLSRAAHWSTSRDEEVCRDLRGLVGPWIYGETTRKRRKLSHRTRRESSVSLGRAPGSKEAAADEQGSSDWSNVYQWLLDFSLRDFPCSVNVVEQWEGPGDVDYGDWGKDYQSIQEEDLRSATRRYVQAGLAIIYATNDHSIEAVLASDRILKKVTQRTDLDGPPDINSIDLKRTKTPFVSGIHRDYLQNLSPVHLLHNALLDPRNPFTTPKSSSISLANVLNVSCYKLRQLCVSKTTRKVAELCLFGSEADQSAELRKMLHTLRAAELDEDDWGKTREQILWLRNWEQHMEPADGPRGIFSKIPASELENEVLRAMLDNLSYRDWKDQARKEKRYDAAKNIYCKGRDRPLPMETVETVVLNAAYSWYDAASECSKETGGVAKASEMLSAFGNCFPKSTAFSQLRALISATNAMSRYTLVLQNGDPLPPVNIRAHKDPISLIGKILSQNKRAYPELDNLFHIGRNMLAAGLVQDAQGNSKASHDNAETEQNLAVIQRRIMQMSIEAALEEGDFDTAYSYVITRLSSGDNKTQDDISWRVAYKAGQFKATSTKQVIALRRLEQRMELISKALLLAPQAALLDVLHTWQELEQQLTALAASEAEAEKRWDEKGDRKIPGDFGEDSRPIAQKEQDITRSGLAEEAPMGLFEVTRRAATALSKNAFPLRGPQKGEAAFTKTTHDRPLSTMSAGSSDEGSLSGAGGQRRARKRDMVSNMVTGGLASGIGWVIGAPPVRQG